MLVFCERAPTLCNILSLLITLAARVGAFFGIIFDSERLPAATPPFRYAAEFAGGFPAPVEDAEFVGTEDGV